MKKESLIDVYEMLIKYKFIKNESEFSLYWMGKSESYWRNLRCRDASPSVGAIAVCGTKLYYYGNLFAAVEDRRELSETFLQHSATCYKYVNRLVGRGIC
jgi:hypothetical protein